VENLEREVAQSQYQKSHMLQKVQRAQDHFLSFLLKSKTPLDSPGILCASSLTTTDQGRTGTSKSLFHLSALTQAKHCLDF